MITVIIPVHNQAEYTKNCINSINHNKVDEIIVVDNASTDETTSLLKSLPVKTITLSTNLGFGEACNVGLAFAKSKYIYFLNNDTILNNTTITALLDRIPGLGAVGSKVIHPDGRLLEAGCFFKQNCSDDLTYQRGKFGDANLYNDFEIVDYCSACSLLVRKDLIPCGFDPLFSPGYYEDVDLCTQIRKQGFLIGYEPKSTIIHYENITSKTLLNPQKLIERNCKTYIAKWGL